MNPQDDWPKRLTRSIASQIKKHREARDWSAQRLADECREYGLDVSRSTLADLENGRRDRITIAELLVIAMALGVAPLLLLCPVGSEESMEILPGRQRPVFPSAQWITGEGPFPVEAPYSGYDHVSGAWYFAAASAALWLYRAYSAAAAGEMRALEEAKVRGERAAEAATDTEREALAAAAATLRQLAESHRATMEDRRAEAVRLGVLPPGPAGGQRIPEAERNAES